MLFRSLQEINLILKNNLILKIYALFIGYSIWFLLSQQQIITHTINVPICLYNTDEKCIVNAPEKVTVTMQGPRAVLLSLFKQQYSLHINAQELLRGDNNIVTTENLFLPDQIKLLNCDPISFQITLSDNPESAECLA